MARSVDGGTALLEEYVAAGQSPFYTIIGAVTRNGPCLAAVQTRKPTSLDSRGKSRDRTSDGFRPGKIPRSELARRLFGSETPAARMPVERVDAAWVHGRGHDPRQAGLSLKSVIVIGCGSVGGFIAQELTMAGVGRLTLVDPESLSWSNIGRHALGAEHVGSNKATALGERLQRNYPHLKVEGFALPYEEFLLEQSEHLAKADLVISATADWKMECRLNLQQVHREIVEPVLYTWTEPHACAGHAVLIQQGQPCLQCGMTRLGESRLQVTEWPTGNETQMEPACGAVFQPYGPIELMGTVSLAASLALDSLLGKVAKATHRVWAGPRSLLVGSGGKWSNVWLDSDESRAKGAFQEECPWEIDSLCPVCGGGAADEGSCTQLASQTNTSSSAPLS
jgi:molybdopterin/thiamine biosynthesis adenylyltransferase